MNKVINRLLVSMCLVLWASALSAQMHWSFDYQAYQHDMTIYFTLQNGSEAVSNLDDYEVAAFVGNECRGIGKFLSQNDVTYGYLRVYSNVTSGETLSFKYYKKSTEEEKNIFGSPIPFVADTNVGYPSTPQVFDLANNVLPGDVDGDGEITVNDVIMAIQASLGNPAENFNSVAADLDNDGEITVNDIIMMIQLSLQN